MSKMCAGTPLERNKRRPQREGQLDAAEHQKKKKVKPKIFFLFISFLFFLVFSFGFVSFFLFSSFVRCCRLFGLTEKNRPRSCFECIVLNNSSDSGRSALTLWQIVHLPILRLFIFIFYYCYFWFFDYLVGTLDTRGAGKMATALKYRKKKSWSRKLVRQPSFSALDNGNQGWWFRNNNAHRVLLFDYYYYWYYLLELLFPMDVCRTRQKRKRPITRPWLELAVVLISRYVDGLTRQPKFQGLSSN